MTDPFYADDLVTVLHGDCLDVLANLPDASVDAVVTDPPYLLSFMGREWDTKGAHEHLAFHAAWAAECLRVLKPGGHLLAFGGTRTYHRLTCAIEDAGFEIRDSIVTWLYGTGFPKSLDVGKAIDKSFGDPLAFRRFTAAYEIAVAASEYRHADVDRYLGIKSSSCYWARADHRGGIPPRHHWEKVRDLLGLDADLERLYDEAEREVIQERTMTQGGGTSLQIRMGEVREVRADITAPATDAARQWQGWGTALKPAFEPIVMARKPLSGTVAANVTEHGTGALNIDGCRVNPGTPVTGGGGWSAHKVDTTEGWDRPYVNGVTKTEARTSGRWPTNVVLTHAPNCADECAPGCAVAELDAQSGFSKSRSGGLSTKALGVMNDDAWTARDVPRTGHDDGGGASRFFPVFRYQAKAPTRERPKVNGVAHPTVKPLALMRWLVRLVTPPGGTVLDPFLGSGTTAQAARDEGFRCIGIERDAEYLDLIRARLDAA